MTLSVSRISTTVSEASVEHATADTTQRIIFVNRFFAPDHSATSQILSDLAFFLASSGREVHVVCGDNLYADPGARLRQEEFLDGVHVHRVSGGRFGRSGLAGRAADYIGLYASLRTRVSALLRAGDILIVKTDPPLLTIPLAGLARKRHARFVPWLQDIYPEVAAALGVPLVRGAVGRILAALRDVSLRKAAAVVVIGARMRTHLEARGVRPSLIQVIPNWADESEITPIVRSENTLRVEWGLSDKFVVGYSGNLGRAHEYATLVDAAERLKDRRDLAFLFIGGGHHVAKLKQEVTARNISSLFHFRPYQERALLSQSLSVPDVHWISLRPELEGLIVPSKFYGIAAAGRAVINVGAPNGEIAELVARHQCGVSVRPGGGAEMAQVIERLMHAPEEVKLLGDSARQMLVAHYSRSCAIAKWESLLTGLPGHGSHGRGS